MTTPHSPLSMPPLQPGDIVCCWGTDRVSRVISLMTSWSSFWFAPAGLRWSPSHVAFVVGERTTTDPLLWYESTTLAQGFSGVQVHQPANRWADYQGRCVVYRLTEGNELEAEQIQRLQRRLRRMIETQVPYDLRGAVLSGTAFIQRWLPSRTQALFCSELIARLLQEVGKLNWTSVSKYSPGRLLRTLVWSGIYERVEA